MTPRRIGILGGTFDPIHLGHLRAAEEVRERLGLHRILLVPAGRPPHKQAPAAAAKHRLAMVRAAAEPCPEFEASEIELRKEEASFSVETLEAIAAEHPAARLFFILGADAFAELDSWRQPRRLLALADLVVVSRPPAGLDAVRGSPFLRNLKEVPERPGDLAGETVSGRAAHLLRVTPMPISSTALRAALGQGRSVRFLLPHAVESYILFNRLYRE